MYNILYVLTLIHVHVTVKVQVVYGHSTYQTTVLLSEMSIFWVRAVCEIRLVRYGSKHALQSLSDMLFACTFMHNLKTTGRIGTFYISNDCSSIEEKKLGVPLIWQHHYSQ